jgi:HAD superfamily hydrolase (TIGR01509 family)
MAFSCILLDHDDTLLPTFALRAAVLADAARAVLGRELDAAAFLAASHGRTLEQMSDELTGGDGELAARVVTAYRERYYVANQQPLTPYPGVSDTLAALRERGCRLGVVTSKLGRGAREELERTALLGYMGVLVGADDVRETKPAAEPLHRAMRALGAAPEDTLMVGDTAADILGARAAGVASAAALWGTRDPGALLALDADYALREPEELIALI